jgi:murein DD-endopeptidase MepM/ murein hydrolase activator NlpD
VASVGPETNAVAIASDAALVVSPLPGMLIRRAARGLTTETELTREAAPAPSAGVPAMASGERAPTDGATGERGAAAPDHVTALDLDAAPLSDDSDDRVDGVIQAFGVTGVTEPTEPAWEQWRAHLEALVTVLGHDFATVLTDEDLIRAADVLGVQVGDPVTLGDAENLLAAHRQTAAEVIRALGHDYLTTVTNEDLLLAARRLDLEVGVFVDPYDVDRIIAAGPTPKPALVQVLASRTAIAIPDWEERRGHLEALLDVLGHDFKTRLTDEDLLRAAQILRIEISAPVSLEDAERLLDAHRQRASSVIRRLGHDHKSRVTNGDLLRAAQILRIDVGTFADPYNVDRIMKAGEREIARRAGARLNSASSTNTRTAVFATAQGVRIHVPSRNVKLVGFHQAAYGVARQMSPRSSVRMITLPSRGRATGSRSAADVSVSAGTPVLAPVTGRVVQVQHYALYGRYRDVRIRIVPSDNTSTLVTVLHVTGPRVRVGDWVQGGQTVIAGRSTKFPFTSQIDRFAGSYPHVHIELRRR